MERCMAKQSLAISGTRPGGLGPVLSEVTALLLTILVGIVVISLLVFAPRAFLSGTRFSADSYVTAITEYLSGLAQGDFGNNARGQPIGPVLAKAALRSLQLVGVSLAVALPLGLIWGALLSTVRRGLPRVLLYGLSTLVISMPTFVIMLLAIEAVATLTLRTGVRLALVTGYGMDQHLVLPTTVLALRGAAYMARAVEITQDDIMRQDWMNVARAKGLGGFSLWRRHVLPALQLPLIGSTLGMLRVMVSGLVIVDYLYVWGGLGGKLLDIQRGGIVTASADQAAAGAAVFFLIFFVISDTLGRALLSKADPRLREIASE